VVSLITGAFAASSCLFTFVRLGYEKMGWDLQLQVCPFVTGRDSFI
jgi:hypothetical protein